MLQIYEDLQDRPDTVIRINALTDRSAGILVGHAAPPGCAETLPQDLLLMLGHNSAAAGWPQTSKSAWRLARAWMHGLEIRDLVVYGAWRLNDSDAATLTQIANDDDINVSLVTMRAVRRLPRSFKALTALPVEHLFHGVAARFSSDPAGVDNQMRLPRGLPPLPAADATCFQAECASCIESEQLWIKFARTFDAITSELRRELEHAQTPELVLDVLEQKIRWARDSNDLIVAVRAVQLAALRSRWLVRLSLRSLGVVAAMALDTAPANHRGWPWASHTDPKIQAMAALAWGTMGTARDIADATIGDIDGDCREFKGRPVDAAMAPPIRAQIWLQRNRGQGPGDPLLPTVNGRHHRPKAVSDLLDGCQPTAFNASSIEPTTLRRSLEDLVEIHSLDDDADLSGPKRARRPLLPSACYWDWTYTHGGGSKLQERTGLPRNDRDPRVRDGNGYRRAIAAAAGFPEPRGWPSNRGWHPGGKPGDVSGDAARLHSVLLSVGGGADRHALIRGLQWSAERLHRAEETLRSHLKPTAEILAATLDGRLELRQRSDDTTTTAVAAIRKRSDCDLGLSPAAARLLMRVLEAPRHTIRVSQVGQGRVTALAAMHELHDRRLISIEDDYLSLRQGVSASLHVLTPETMELSNACS